MVSISYCVSVCNEHIELNKLLGKLTLYIQDEDELIVLVDESKVTQEVSEVIKKHTFINPKIKIIGASLNGDFANFKNNFVQNATCNFIFQLDADELLSDDTLIDLKYVLGANPEVDLYLISRENFVEGITQEWVQRWRWNQDNQQRINYPDSQMRIFKNNKQIIWKNKIHEVLTGYKQYATLPSNYYIIHNKTLEKQISQNEFYSKL